MRWIWWWMCWFVVTPGYGFLWTLFGGNNCNCCRCPSSSPSSISRFPQHNFFAAPTLVPQYQNSYSYSYSPPAPPPPPPPPPSSPTAPPTPPVYDTVSELIPTTPESYRGPPAAAPNSQEQLYNDERKYATNQVAYQSESRPLTVTEYGGLTELENELAEEKYKYNLQKAKEREESQKKQTKIKVFKIKPHKSSKVSIGMVEWQASQVAKYTNEKAQVDKFIEATSNTNGLNENESLEEFIPIEIGNEPEYADEEPAGPPPNVRNRISHDPVLINSLFRRRFIL